MLSCLDAFGWENGRGKTCADYEQWCERGGFRVGASWAGGETFNWPEKNCCVCGGRGSAASPPPPPPSDGNTAHGYALHLTFSCRGADRQFKKEGLSAELCESHCASRKCACAHYGKGQCRFTYTFTGILHSGEGYSAFVRPGAVRATLAHPHPQPPSLFSLSLCSRPLTTRRARATSLVPPR